MKFLRNNFKKEEGRDWLLNYLVFENYCFPILVFLLVLEGIALDDELDFFYEELMSQMHPRYAKKKKGREGKRREGKKEIENENEKELTKHLEL